MLAFGLIAVACDAGTSVVATRTPTHTRTNPPAYSPPSSGSPSPGGDSPFDPYPTPTLASPEQVTAAKREITHVVFLIKENRKIGRAHV